MPDTSRIIIRVKFRVIVRRGSTLLNHTPFLHLWHIFAIRTRRHFVASVGSLLHQHPLTESVKEITFSKFKETNDQKMKQGKSNYSASREVSTTANRVGVRPKERVGECRGTYNLRRDDDIYEAYKILARINRPYRDTDWTGVQPEIHA
ncbi:hypothetical protein J6590_073965 [Homalodisca vitripennis]|nr:hypothetical protein J6590_073965 [Homalodisca vitripennis]